MLPTNRNWTFEDLYLKFSHLMQNNPIDAMVFLKDLKITVTADCYDLSSISASSEFYTKTVMTIIKRVNEPGVRVILDDTFPENDSLPERPQVRYPKGQLNPDYHPATRVAVIAETILPKTEKPLELPPLQQTAVTKTKSKPSRGEPMQFVMDDI